jgi:MFS family permease
MAAEISLNGSKAPARGPLVLAARAVTEVFRNADLRNLSLASASFVAGEWAYTVALAVYAYRFGGAAWVGIVGFIRMVPAAVSGPLVGTLADRYPRERVLLIAYLSRALALAASAAAALGKLPPVVFILAGIVTVVSSVSRPCEWSLRAALARTPEELAATNVAGSIVEGVSVFVGPALAGVLLAKTSPGVVFLVTAQLSLAGAVALSFIRVYTRLEPRAAPGVSTLAREVAGGVKDVARQRDLRLLFGLFFGQTFTRGALNVLVVVAAIRLLHMGDPGVGYLNSAFGVGNLIGAFASFTLVGRRRLAGPAGVGLILWAAPLALVALVPHPIAALVLLAIPGFGNGVLDVAGLTLIQRITPARSHGRVFGTLETVVFIGVAIGSIVTPGVIAWLGIKGALIAIGVLLPAAAVLAFAGLRDVDRRAEVPEHELEVLRATPLFASLPAITLDRLAQNAERVEARKGTTIIRAGEAGDRFYVIESGKVGISIGGRRKGELGMGDHFGEIALLRSMPRTATVKVSENAVLYALDGDEFVAAVTGDDRSMTLGNRVASERLAASRKRGVRTLADGRR